MADKKKNENSSANSKTYFVTFNNPENHGYSGDPKELCDKLVAKWIKGGEGRRAACTYCVSKNGMRHVHIVLATPKSMRLERVIKEFLPPAHCKYRKGTRQQAADYLYKTGPYKNSEEEVIAESHHGDVCTRRGNKNEWDLILESIKRGLTPRMIVKNNPKHGRIASDIRRAYFDWCRDHCPPQSPKNVHYVYGKSGTGKSYEYTKLCNEHGKENVFKISDYGPGAFDEYMGEPILILDNFKGQFNYDKLMVIVSDYDSPIMGRYGNVRNVWKDIYINSPYAPKDLYKVMVDVPERTLRPLDKLLTYITDITLCTRDWSGAVTRHTCTGDDYRKDNCCNL